MSNKSKLLDKFDELPVYIYPEDYEQQVEMGGKPKPVIITAFVDLGHISMIYKNSEDITYFILQGDATSTPLSMGELRHRISQYHAKRVATIEFNGFNFRGNNEQ